VFPARLLSDILFCAIPRFQENGRAVFTNIINEPLLLFLRSPCSPKAVQMYSLVFNLPSFFEKKYFSFCGGQ